MNQRKRIQAHLEQGKSLTRIQALTELGILNPTARISELRSSGYPIITTMIDVVNRYDEKVQVARWSKSS